MVKPLIHTAVTRKIYLDIWRNIKNLPSQSIPILYLQIIIAYPGSVQNMLKTDFGGRGCIVISYAKISVFLIVDKSTSNPQPIGFSGILLAKRQNSFYCTYFLHNRNVADTKSPYPIKRLEVIRWFNQKSMVFNQSLS